MYEQQIREDIFYLMFYAAVAMLSLIACCYLLFRRANAFAPNVTPSLRLRRWTAALFASMTLSHLWYSPIPFLNSCEDIMLNYLVGAMLDFLTLIPIAITILFVMLQDRRRPLWLVGVMVFPPAVALAVCIARRSDALLPQIYTYHLLSGIGLALYMVRATRQYGRWLRENYADLEHKEVWQSFIVLAIILLVFGIYSLSVKGPVYKYITQVNNIILVCYFLWRVETLSDLSITVKDPEEETEDKENVEDNDYSLSIRNKIGPLLKRHCEDTQLYLQYDTSITQLAKVIGTNRSYLSNYFATHGTTYNAYINGLRIQHFINLYHEAVAAHQPVTTKQLAYQSGFRSYSTFSAVFKQIMGTNATEWMRNTTE